MGGSPYVDAADTRVALLWLGFERIVCGVSWAVGISSSWDAIGKEMTLGRGRPPLVPDPGQQVLLLSEDGSRIEGFRAVSAPMSTESGEIIIRVAIEQEYKDSRREGRRAVSMAWPAERVEVFVPWYRWQRWFTR
jgi:hypothetical protein